MRSIALAIRPGTLRRKNGLGGAAAMRAHCAHHRIVGALRGIRQIKIRSK
jgi:hypothetical protein